jgi:hypothetical protein
MSAVLEALRAAVDAKAAYWDRMHELEAALGCEDPIDKVNDLLVDQIDSMAVNVNCPGDVTWITEEDAADLQGNVQRLNEEAA